MLEAIFVKPIGDQRRKYESHKYGDDQFASLAAGTWFQAGAKRFTFRWNHADKSIVPMLILEQPLGEVKTDEKPASRSRKIGETRLAVLDAMTRLA